MIESMKYAVDSVISGEWESCKFDLMPPYHIIDYIRSKHTATEEGDMDTNGWQVDYWTHFVIADIKYQLSGSMYYGGATFSVDKD